MLEQKYIPIEEYENSTVKNKFDYLYNKDEEIKDDNEDIVEHGNDFLNCKIIHSK